jgi:branched-chain amino acid transport system ATP-binding protein
MAVVEVEGVTKLFGSLAALNDVSFQVEEDELFGIAGPNGAGKSVLFSVISGFYRPTSGRVAFEGQDIVGLGPHQICHLGLTRTFQTPATFHSISVRENVLVGRLFGARRADRVPEILRFLDLEGVADAKATNLDLYTTKKVVLAAALATDCKVLMLDEPMAGFSHVEIESFLGLIRRINREWGVTIMIIEHLLDVLIGVTDRMMILHYGEVLYCGSPDSVKNDQRVVDVYLGGGTAE